MKAHYTLFISLAFLLTQLTSCGSEDNSSNEVDSEDYNDFESLSLKEFDIPVYLMIPGETANIGASTEPEIDHKPNHHKWRIDVGQNFHFEIDDWGNEKDMISFTKKQLADNKMFDIKYLTDEKDFIFFEKTLKVDGNKNASSNVGVDHKTYAAYAQYEIKGVTYIFRSRDEGDPKIIAEFVAKTIRSVKEIGKK
jgi:hypothetical protein